MISPFTVLGFSGARAYHPELGGEKLDLSLLERTLRRGLSEVTKLSMHAAKGAIESCQRERAGLDLRALHVIFASAFGELAVAEALLAEAVDADGSSPVRFRHSVHNTAPALFSLSTHNHLPHTALAAGWRTVSMGLLEAATQLACDAERVLLVFAEERVPTALSEEHAYEPMAVALLLGRAQELGVARLCDLRPTDARRAHHEFDPAPSHAHPLAGAQALLRQLEHGQGGLVELDDHWTLTVEVAR